VERFEDAAALAAPRQVARQHLPEKGRHAHVREPQKTTTRTTRTTRKQQQQEQEQLTTPLLK
jgi:hypothetical protein